MPRGPRNFVEGGYYHIVARGLDKRILFREDKDFRVFMKIMREYLQEYPVRILHYCLMPNHIHVLIRLSSGKELSKFMQGLSQKYAAYFRKKYESNGFVFQNRYKSFLIAKESYLLECARYIERNPLRAGLIKNLFDYEFSSYGFYTKGVDDGIITVINEFYLGLSSFEKVRRKQYAAFVSVESPHDSLTDRALNFV